MKNLNKENFDKLIELVQVATNKPGTIILPQWYIEENPDNLYFWKDDKYGLMLWNLQVLILKRSKYDIEEKILCQEKL